MEAYSKTKDLPVSTRETSTFLLYSFSLKNLQIILINNLPIQNEIHQYQKAVDLRLKAI
jgi:hypothetical protein